MRWIIRPGIGLGELLFGSSREVVQSQLGEPERVEEALLTVDPRITWFYWEQGVSVQFDGEDGFRLGTLQTDREDAELYGHRLIGHPEDHVRSVLGQLSLGSAGFEVMRFSDHPSLGWLRYDERGLSFWFKNGRLDSVQWNPLIGPDDVFLWPVSAD
jgi:hypothetical protein